MIMFDQNFRTVSVTLGPKSHVLKAYSPRNFPFPKENVGAVGLLWLAGFGRRRDASQTGNSR